MESQSSSSSTADSDASTSAMPTPNERLGLQFLSENLGKYKLVTDISNINYTEGEQLLSDQCISSNYITDHFCDNLILVKICDESDWNEQYSNDCIAYLQKEFLKVTSTFSQYEVRTNEVAVSLQTNTDRVAGVRKIIREIGADENYPNPVCIFYEVDLACVELKHLLRETPNLLQTLQENHYFLVKLNIIQDFVGIFDKTEMTNYLTNNYNFCDEAEFQGDYKIFMSNEENEGMDSIKWKEANVQFRMYNKFISVMTNPGFKKIGNKIVDFVDSPNKHLKKTFSSAKAKEHGITRLEMTIHNFEDDGREKKYQPLSDCLNLLENSKIYLENEDAPMYSVSIAKMWQKLTDTLHNSCCVVCDNILQYAYWGNIYNEQFTGVQIELSDDLIERDEQITYALSQFSFNNLPINYLELFPERNEVIQKCFKKSGETFFTRSGDLRSTISHDLDIASTGLIKTENVIPEVLRKGKTPSIHSITPIRATYLVSTSIHHDYPSSSQETELPSSQNFEIEDSQESEHQNSQDVQKESSEEVESQEIERNLDEICSTIENLAITTPLSRFFLDKNWKTLDQAGSYEISAFTVREIGGIHFHVGILAENENNDCKKVYNLKGTYKNHFLHYHKNPESLLNEGYRITTYNGLEIIHLKEETPFATLKIDKNAVIEDLKFVGNSWNTICEMTEENLSTLFLKETWKDLDRTGEYTVYAYTVQTIIINKTKLSSVGILCQEKNTWKQYVYSAERTLKEEFKIRHEQRHLFPEAEYGIITCGHLDIVYLKSGEAFAEFKTTNDHGCSYPTVVDLHFFNNYDLLYIGENYANAEATNVAFKEDNEELKNLFDLENWKYLNETGVYTVYAFTVAENRGYSYVGLLATKENAEFKQVYCIDPKCGKQFTDFYRTREILVAEGDCDMIKLCDFDIMFLATKMPLASFEINDLDPENSYGFPIIENLQLFL